MQLDNFAKLQERRDKGSSLSGPTENGQAEDHEVNLYLSKPGLYSTSYVSNDCTSV
jgi:hypothetical protein